MPALQASNLGWRGDPRTKSAKTSTGPAPAGPFAAPPCPQKIDAICHHLDQAVILLHYSPAFRVGLFLTGRARQGRHALVNAAAVELCATAAPGAKGIGQAQGVGYVGEGSHPLKFSAKRHIRYAL